MPKRVSQLLPHKSDRVLENLLPFGGHGDASLPGVDVESYNLEIQQRGRFVGDQANKKAMFEALEARRKAARKRGDDPLGKVPTDNLTKKKLEKILSKGEPAAASLVQAALDDFSERLVKVIRRFRKLPEWKRVQRIAIGGGFRGGRIGELAIVRAQSLLDAEKIPIELRAVDADPDEAGLIGAAYLAPAWIFAGYDGILSVDIGGSNIRSGILRLKQSRRRDPVKARVLDSLIWEHAEEDVNRDEAVKELIAMLQKLTRRAARERFRLAPFIGIGCPGRIRSDGTIDRGAQNLPGNWEAHHFNLPYHLRQHVSIVPGQETTVIIHNDAVVQGLSELPAMRDVDHWAILTIGTGLGNAKFRTRPPLRKKE
jgi:predicted NBD/HSP70 family sugar kinase